ncbi:uncharacterized protein CPUR_00610 [Claviceps purpurea 20.1]|uniref:Uncharacterized protein n=1 Tax=Claviceps purpurea (strain 20.1) TaxID=1111077 RepID=M1W5A1_CLAP2|nr:uncharacterized protein CPUR_00610 [Claviceps purpurea 20.1]
MHVSPEEIARRLQTIALPPPTVHPEVESFFEDDYIDDITVQHDESETEGHRKLSRGQRRLWRVLKREMLDNLKETVLTRHRRKGCWLQA